MSRCAEQHTGGRLRHAGVGRGRPRYPNYLNDFADIAEIGGLKSFSKTRVDALQVGDGVGLGLRLGCEACTARGNPQTP